MATTPTSMAITHQLITTQRHSKIYNTAHRHTITQISFFNFLFFLLKWAATFELCVKLAASFHPGAAIR